MNIKPIDTLYKGHNFRSRLEARWAVFFDACGADWEYEPQGFELPNGQYYLPDFLIHNAGLYDMKKGWDSADIYVEIKGQMTKEDADKIYEFKQEYPIVILGELPYGNGQSADKAVMHHGKVDFFSAPFFRLDTVDITVYNFAFPGIDLEGRFGFFGDDSRFIYRDEEATLKAYHAANLARFDHGEIIEVKHPRWKTDPDKYLYIKYQGHTKGLYSLLTRKNLQNYIENTSLEKMVDNFENHTRSYRDYSDGWLIDLDKQVLQYYKGKEMILKIPFDEISSLSQKAKENGITLDGTLSDQMQGAEHGWAKFFELCHTDYIYHPEVDGTDFVPDFLIPDINIDGYAMDLYVVVNDVSKEAADFSSNHHVLIVDGMPLEDDVAGYCDCCWYFYDNGISAFNFETITGEELLAVPGVNKEGKFDVFTPDSLENMDEYLTSRYYDQATWGIYQ